MIWIYSLGQVINAYNAGKKAAYAENPTTLQAAAEALLSSRFGGYGNRKAMQAMWEYVYKEHGRHMLPVSHYDGVLQAGLKAILGKDI